MKTTRTGLVLTPAVAVLVLFAFHYPLASAIPFGGDAAVHILQAQYPFRAPPWRNVAERNSLLRSPYPVSAALFAATRALPFSWPRRFTVAMALGHLAAGLLIGRILWRLFGSLEAALGMLLWAATTVELLPFFRAGTLPQLLSLVFLLAFLERTIARDWRGATLAVLAVALSHPASTAVLVMLLAAALPVVLADRWKKSPARRVRETATLALVGTTAVGLTLISLSAPWFPYGSIEADGRYRTLTEFLGTRYALIFFLSPVGFALIGSARRVPFPARLILLTFGAVAVLLAFNGSLGFGLWEKRFLPYAIVAVTVFGAIGLLHLARSALPIPWMRGAVLATLVASILTAGWSDAARTYRELTGDRSAVTPSERDAYEWSRTHLSPDAVLLTSDARGRSIEWIAVVADRGIYSPRLAGGSTATAMLRGSREEVLQALPHSPVSHALIYRRFEDVPVTYQRFPDLFPVLYDQGDVIILQLPRGARKSHGP